MKKSNVSFFVISILIFIGTISTLKYFNQDTSTLYLDIKTGDSESTIAKKLGLRFISEDNLNNEFYGDTSFFQQHDASIKALAKLIITPQIRTELKSKYAIIPLLGEKAILRVNFYQDKAYHIELRFLLPPYASNNLSTLESKITTEVKTAYPGYIESPSKTNEGVYSLAWSRHPVIGYLQINSIGGVVFLEFSNYNIFDDLAKKQKELSSSPL